MTQAQTDPSTATIHSAQPRTRGMGIGTGVLVIGAEALLSSSHPYVAHFNIQSTTGEYRVALPTLPTLVSTEIHILMYSFNWHSSLPTGVVRCLDVPVSVCSLVWKTPLRLTLLIPSRMLIAFHRLIPSRKLIASHPIAPCTSH